MATTIRVQQIDHVTLVVEDLSRSRAFYVDLLGMTEVARPAFSFPGAWFQAGSTLVHLIEAHEGSGRPGVDPDRAHGSRCHHLAFSVEDAAAAAEHLQECGIPIIGDVRRRPDGAVQVFLPDPDGHIVELCSEPDQD